MSRVNRVQKPNKVDVDKIKFQEPKILDNGGKMVFISYQDSTLCVQTPVMTMPWAMKKDVYDGVTKYSLDLQFKDMESNPKLEQFHDFLGRFDEKMIESGVKKSLAWFKKSSMKREICEELVSKQVIHSKDKDTGEPDGKWPDRFKAKLALNKDGTFKTKVFDSDMNRIPDDQFEELLVKGCEVKALLENSGIWLAGSKFGCGWRVDTLVITKKANNVGYAFIDSDEEDGGVSSDVDIVEVNEKASSNFIEDSDSDIDVSEESEPEVVPEPVVKKKRTKKSA